MPRLTLKFKNNVIKVYNFNRDKSISIGRRENNDIVIANLTVSGHHAKIDFIGDGYLLTDLKSKNKTYVNDAEVTSVQLNDKDLIGIGKHTIVFNLEESDSFENESDTGMDQTMAMNSEVHKELIRASSEKLTIERTGVLGYIEGGEGKIELNRNRINIGKDPNSDIIINGLFIPKTIAVINHTPQGYSLNFCGRFIKVKVNNKVVKDPVLLDEFDMIKIGSIEFQFFYK